MDNENLIIELLKESREQQKELVKNSAEHREDTIVWQNNTDHRLENIETDLREHKEGVIQNRETLKIFHDRLEHIEASKNTTKKIISIILRVSAGISVVAGSIYSVIKLF